MLLCAALNQIHHLSLPGTLGSEPVSAAGSEDVPILGRCWNGLVKVQTPATWDVRAEQNKNLEINAALHSGRHLGMKIFFGQIKIKWWTWISVKEGAERKKIQQLWREWMKCHKQHCYWNPLMFFMILVIWVILWIGFTLGSLVTADMRLSLCCLWTLHLMKIYLHNKLFKLLK